MFFSSKWRNMSSPLTVRLPDFRHFAENIRQPNAANRTLDGKILLDTDAVVQ